MPIKANWTEYLHGLRRREMDIVFANCPKKTFSKALELGAGDGFISTILAEYAEELICTDLNPERLSKTDADNVSYKIIDAEEVGDIFEAEEFDFVFSSSLLEHLPDVDRALKGINKILSNDGISIHFMPNRYWKIATVLLHVPNKVAKTIDKMLAGRLFKRRKGHKLFKPHKEVFGGNNMKIGRRKQFFLSKLFLPRTHGISNDTLTEFVAFGSKQWIKKFELADFTVLEVKKCGFNSGYGFGWDQTRKFMENIGIHTVYAYIVCKKHKVSKYAHLFLTK